VQHTATHCNASQHTATQCNTLQHNATHCGISIWQHRCNSLQHNAPHCNTFWNSGMATTDGWTHYSTLQHTATHVELQNGKDGINRWVDNMQHTAIRCNTLRSCKIAKMATSGRWTHYNTLTDGWTCNTLQHAATRCNTLQHAATRCNTLQLIITHVELQDGKDGNDRWVNTLQHPATPCNTLQHPATHCNTSWSCKMAKIAMTGG